MTSTADLNYKYYQKLEGTWKDVKGSCEAVLSRFSGIEIRYGNEELHLEMMDLNDGHKEDLVLARVKEDVPLAEGEFQCSCGYRGEARRFCPNCGKEII